MLTISWLLFENAFVSETFKIAFDKEERLQLVYLFLEVHLHLKHLGLFF